MSPECSHGSWVVDGLGSHASFGGPFLTDTAGFFDPGPWGRIAPDNARSLHRSGLVGHICPLPLNPVGLADRFLRIDSPRMSMRWALWTNGRGCHRWQWDHMSVKSLARTSAAHGHQHSGTSGQTPVGSLRMPCPYSAHCRALEAAGAVAAHRLQRKGRRGTASASSAGEGRGSREIHER